MSFHAQQISYNDATEYTPTHRFDKSKSQRSNKMINNNNNNNSNNKQTNKHKTR